MNDTIIKINLNKENCVICLDPINNANSNQIYILNCKHIYHKKCLDTYHEINLVEQTESKCPLCRKPFTLKLGFRKKVKTVLKRIRQINFNSIYGLTILLGISIVGLFVMLFIL